MTPVPCKGGGCTVHHEVEDRGETSQRDLAIPQGPQDTPQTGTQKE